MDQEKKEYLPTAGAVELLNAYAMAIRDLQMKQTGAMEMVLKQAGLLDGSDWSWDGAKFVKGSAK